MNKELTVLDFFEELEYRDFILPLPDHVDLKSLLKSFLNPVTSTPKIGLFIFDCLMEALLQSRFGKMDYSDFAMIRNKNNDLDHRLKVMEAFNLPPELKIIGVAFLATIRCRRVYKNEISKAVLDILIKASTEKDEKDREEINTNP
jgi:hypothetical protein